MKLKTVLVVVLLSFVALSVGYLVLKEVGLVGAPAAGVKAPAVPSPAVAAGSSAVADPAKPPTAGRAAANAEPALTTEPALDGDVVTVYWFYDNKH